MKKILFYTNHIDIESGGSTYSIISLMDELKERGFDLKIIVNKRRKKEIKTTYPIIALNASLGDWNRHLVLRKVINEENPDFVFGNMHTQNITLSLTKGFGKRKVKSKCIAIVRSTGNYDINKKFWRFPYRIYMKKIFENLDATIAVSEAVKKDLEKAYFLQENRVNVIYNPFNLKKIKEMSEEDIPKKERILFEKHDVIINSGRFTEQKRQDLLIKTYAKVKERLPNTKLVILGSSGVAKNNKIELILKNLVKAYGLDNNVIFLGYKPNPHKYVKKSKLFVLTSKYEGLARAIIESLAVGTPVVAFNSEEADQTEIFGGNSEVIVPYPDTNMLADRIVEILTNKEKYLNLKKQTYKIAKRFSTENSVQAYIKLIDEFSE